MIDERLRAALAALAASMLHLALLAWWLPGLSLWPGGAASPDASESLPGDLEIDRPFIAVTLPAGPMDLEWSLGSIDAAAPTPRFQRPEGKSLGNDRLSQLGDAAAEAEAPAERASDALTELTAAPAEFIAEISLADAQLRLAPMSGGLALRASDALTPPAADPAPEPVRPQPVTPVEPASEDPARAIPTSAPRATARPKTQPSPSANPATAERPAPTVPPTAPPTPTPAPLATLSPVATPPPTPVVTPNIDPPQPSPSNTALPPPLPDLAPPQAPASATPPPSLMLGEGNTPDRGLGSGAFTPNSNAFFSRMTAHLFAANQRALAEAIRAGPKLTVVVRFWIDRQGRVLDARVARSSGVPELDRRAEKVLLDASPVPRLAPDMPQATLELSFPVQVYR